MWQWWLLSINYIQLCFLQYKDTALFVKLQGVALLCLTAGVLSMQSLLVFWASWCACVCQLGLGACAVWFVWMIWHDDGRGKFSSVNSLTWILETQTTNYSSVLRLINFLVFNSSGCALHNQKHPLYHQKFNTSTKHVCFYGLLYFPSLITTDYTFVSLL